MFGLLGVVVGLLWVICCASLCCKENTVSCSLSLHFFGCSTLPLQLPLLDLGAKAGTRGVPAAAGAARGLSCSELTCDCSRF